MAEHKKLLVIDASGIIYRAYHALPNFNNASGVPTNAVYGFIKMVLSVIDTLKPDYFALCFDTPGKTFRNNLSKDYQAQRPSPPDDLKRQFPLVQEFVNLSGLPTFLAEGFEADDVIGTVAVYAQTHMKNVKTFIVTGDRDILQLVNNNTTVVMPKVGVSSMEFVDEEGVVKKLGVPSNKIVDYKALVGDPSDNYHGVRGIGPKKAIQLLSKYGTFAGIYEHLNELDEKTRNLLTTYKADADMSYLLAKIETNVPLKLKENQFVFHKLAPSNELIAYLDKYSLRSIKMQMLGEKKESKKVQSDKPIDKLAADQLSFF